MLQDNNGYLKAADAIAAGISRSYFADYVDSRGLVRVAYGLYISADARKDEMYIIQTCYPTAVFSHETALYLLGFAEHEPTTYTVTLKTGANTNGLSKKGVKVYKVKAALFSEGIAQYHTLAGHTVRTYCAERTICDLARNRRNIKAQVLQSAIKTYLKLPERNIPLLLRYTGILAVEKLIRGYLEELL
jgi:predicted transcriptional regulator of viral defense system